MGQLTLVEHALCPLFAAGARKPNLVHEAGFFYMNKDRQLGRATARVTCPLGLLASDDLMLWGLLALTMSQPQADGELYATPHYCLRQLRMIDEKTRRGGRQYRQFADALRRLSLVSYENDAFYDPKRKEHRNVSFGFLSYSLPIDDTSRAWRIVWDPLFFEMVQPVGGSLMFDFEVYRQLDAASRRLFLLVSKIFARRSTTPAFDIRHLCVDVLGFSPQVASRDLKRKLRRCIGRLADIDVVIDGPDTFKATHGRVRLRRGSYFSHRRTTRASITVEDSAISEPLREIGFDVRGIRWLLRSFPMPVLREWADITLAAMERQNQRFIRTTPQAYFVDNVKHAAAGDRTPPDWWHQVRKGSERRTPEPGKRHPTPAISPELVSGSTERLEDFVRSQVAAAASV